MTLDNRTSTAKARREIINKHLYRDHGGLMAVQGESLEERYTRHQALHAAGGCDHDHQDYTDLSAEYGHYLGARPLRVRTDRPPKQWTITWHLARHHNERVVGDDLAKLMFHEQLHNTEGGWAGDPLHRHEDLSEPEETEYK